MNAPALRPIETTLHEIQSRLEATPGGALTLDPSRTHATPLPDLVRSLASPGELEPLAVLATSVAASQLDNFPENLFWDFDGFLGSAHRQALRSSDYVSHLRKVADVTVSLMTLYGQRSQIRFRYVHDFMYGFDWARWVRREPEEREGIEPFGVRFLDQSKRRGLHILELIGQNDAVYPQLDGDFARNPFPFSREPEEELRLYQDLSARGLIPVPAWRVDAEPVWDRDFDALREERAQTLGLGRKDQSDAP